jgi:hypothetical protein
MRVAFLDAPAHYEQLIEGAPADLTEVSHSESSIDFVHLFVREAAGLGERLETLRWRIATDGMIWVSWPKRASKVPTDVTEDVIRAAALPTGLDDVKVCAVDETGSGLKHVIRKEERAARRP